MTLPVLPLAGLDIERRTDQPDRRAPLEDGNDAALGSLVVDRVARDLPVGEAKAGSSRSPRSIAS
jgi:hypothetical protein